MASNMRGGWKVSPSEVNRQRSIEESYRQTDEFKAKNSFGIYWPILTIVLFLIFT